MPTAPEAPIPKKPDGRLVWLRHACGSTITILVSKSTPDNEVPFPPVCPGKHECSGGRWEVIGEFHGD